MHPHRQRHVHVDERRLCERAPGVLLLDGGGEVPRVFEAQQRERLLEPHARRFEPLTASVRILERRVRHQQHTFHLARGHLAPQHAVRHQHRNLTVRARCRGDVRDLRPVDADRGVDKSVKVGRVGNHQRALVVGVPEHFVRSGFEAAHWDELIVHGVVEVEVLALVEENKARPEVIRVHCDDGPFVVLEFVHSDAVLEQKVVERAAARAVNEKILRQTDAGNVEGHPALGQ
mmetsp:Transcript_7353/g.24402  ORF Transcript_7353/g.24402 Transcript_7353/m.24402 type:complete len:232 (+) Transcript_7353:2031-2726(+)